MSVPFTPEQIAHRLAVIAAYDGDIRAAAQQLRVKHGTLREWLARLPDWQRNPVKDDDPKEPPVTPPPPPPPPPKEIHDAAFWRKKAKSMEHELGALAHLAEQLSGVRGIPYQIPNYALIPPAGVRAQSVVGVHWSDVHMGEKIDAEEIGGINEFNSEICRLRLRRHISAACNIGSRWAADTDCVGAYFALGGDLISGDIHEELRMTNDLTSHEQVQAMVEEVIAGIRHLKEAFGFVHVTCVPGNHGRNTPKPTAKLYARLSYDMMIGAMVQREFVNDPRVTFQISAAKDQVTPIFGRNVLSTHGDKMGTGGGQGFAGPFLPIVRGAKKTLAQYASKGTNIDLMIHGHYHTSGNPGNVLSNGSVPGYSEYGDDLRFVIEPPQQNLFLMHSRWGLRERMPIQLEEPKPPVKPRVRVPANWVSPESNAHG
jgi:hypothetical protein